MMQNSDLAGRLRLLMDSMKVTRGSEPTFPEVQAFLKERGVGLGRARWSYLINEHRSVDDPALIEGLAAFFGVEASYLTDGEPVPEQLNEKIDDIRSMRVSQVYTYAARSLGDVSPEALERIAKILDESVD